MDGLRISRALLPAAGRAPTSSRALVAVLIAGLSSALAAPQNQGRNRLRVSQLGPDTGARPNPEPVAPGGAQVAQPPPRPEPVKIGLGQTTDQVVDLSSKKIYTYKELKITFVDGRVSDVQ
jgi:hypothetical protein